VPGTNIDPEAHLTGRQRRRLRLGRENGYLNAACRDHPKLLAAYARWCWRLRIPIVWSERRSPRSKYGRVRLDLYTTSERLSAAGEAELRALAFHATTSPHDARWEFIPLRDVDRLAAAVFRAATRAANHQPHRACLAALPDRQGANVFVIGQSRASA
jgi:hypothetical protein